MACRAPLSNVNDGSSYTARTAPRPTDDRESVDGDRESVRQTGVNSGCGGRVVLSVGPDDDN